MDRSFRYLSGKKQDKIRVVKSQPSVQSMRDGQELLYLNKNGSLSRYRKERGKLFQSDMTSTGNQFIEKKLTASKLEYRKSFIDYRVFKHSFTDDLPATKIYVPWQGTGEQTTLLESRSGFLAPFNMTCHKLIIRTPALNTAATDIVFGIDKIDNGDTSIDSVCTYDATDTWSDNTNFTITKSEWSAPPNIQSGDLVGISMQADNTNIVTSEKHFHLTSVWRMEIQI